MSVAIIGVVATVGTAAYGAYSQQQAQKEAQEMQNQAIDANKRNYGNELGNTLGAQLGTAQEQYLAEKQYQSLYSRNAGWDTTRIANIFGDNAAKQMGLYQDAALKAQNMQRRGDIKALNKMGQKYTSSYLNATPEVASLLRGLSSQAEQELALGQSLSPEEERMVQQRARAGYAARGTGLTDQSNLAEVLQGYEYGRQRQNERRQFAAQTMGQANAIYSPAMQYFMREATGAQMYPQMLNAAIATRAGAGPAIFNPESSYAGNLYNQQSQIGLMNGLGQAQSHQSAAAAEAQALQQAVGGLTAGAQGWYANRPATTTNAAWAGNVGGYSYSPSTGYAPV